MILHLVEEAEVSGARTAAACTALGMNVRTIERWRAGAGEDLREGPKTEPANALSATERRAVIDMLNQPTFRELSPSQVVPRLADQGRYLASESTMYRILRDENLLCHRGRARPPSRRPPAEHLATAPNQVWSWDITYLRSPVVGAFFYLYLVMDIWSRKIVGWEVHAVESPDLASKLIARICKETGVDPTKLVLHSDNGGPMKGSTMLATMQKLGIQASFSRPHVSNDNPFSEALFRTLKYRPEYPDRAFASIETARDWVATFVTWYNTTHQHSGIRFVTPDDRHSGREAEILEQRQIIYEQAQAAHPERWSKETRCWEPVAEVYLNPERPQTLTAPGGLGALVPSGAGQRPDEAQPPNNNPTAKAARTSERSAVNARPHRNPTPSGSPDQVSRIGGL